MIFLLQRPVAIALTLVCGCLNCGWAQDQTLRLEETAIQRAVERVASSIVQIETVGGLDQVAGIQPNEGPTTGVIVSEDGYILSSMINFVQQPSSIVIRFADNEIAPAEIIANDHSRKLVLLKVTGQKRLKSIELIHRSQLSVGQTVIAAGKTYDVQHPNISVGILSALNRIWDRAVQTDAKISPANFGGPLIDLNGRMIGILVPLSPTQSDVVSGVDWYDSGIGFAVPVQDLLEHFDMMTAGTDLKPGLLGVAFRDANIYADQAVVSVCFEGAPAAGVGIQPGDVIVEFNGRPIGRQSDFKHAIGRFYAGDEVNLTVDRGDIQLEFRVELAGEIKPFQQPTLGVVLVPSAPPIESVEIRYVIPNSPAAKSGLTIGDVITSVNGNPTKTRDELALALIQGAIGETVELGFRTATDSASDIGGAQVELRPQSAELLPGVARLDSAQSTRTIDISISDFPNRCFAILPADPTAIASLLVWIPEPGEINKQQFVDAWRDVCMENNVAIVVPQSRDETKWASGESEFIVKTVNLLSRQFPFDPSRVAIGGHRSGASMAALTCFAERDRFRGLVMIDAVFLSRIENPMTSAVNPLMVFVGSSSDFDKRDELENSIERLKRARFPVCFNADGPLKLQEWGGMVLGWVDTLDRL